MTSDQRTADAFASSWNNLPLGSVYTQDQFEDWLHPVEKADVAGKSVLELGCGNGSLLVHMANWSPAVLEGVDLGESVRSARTNLGRLAAASNWRVIQADMTEFRKPEGYDFVYSIGVLHHLTEPKRGLDSVVANTKVGGRFHCWVYAREGNSIIIAFVDPIRRIASRLPWWATKYCLATPLVVPYYLYAKAISRFRHQRWVGRLPLYKYSIWISNRAFPFFRHVAFDQLVTPKTTYIRRETIEEWLKAYRNVDQESTYIVMRNGNSWKFGGRIK
ncbi:MAG TPA: class I SAM-dependent methyltransferase [Casimicrobiaceae bacterium]|jgi:SAM-dependent methyltransferase